MLPRAKPVADMYERELRVRKVIDLRSLFFHNHYSCSSQNNRVTVRIHTMAAARWPLIPSKNPLSTSLLFSLNHMLLCKLWASYYGTCVLCSLVSLRQQGKRKACHRDEPWQNDVMVHPHPHWCLIVQWSNGSTVGRRQQTAGYRKGFVASPSRSVMGCPGLSPSILSDTMLSVRSRSSQENGGWCIPTCNFNTLPGTYYLRALTCRPVVWGSVTLVILQSSCIINVIMLLPHKQLDKSMVLLRQKQTWLLHIVKLYHCCTVSWHLTVHFSLYSFLFSCLTLSNIKNFVLHIKKGALV